MFYRTATGRIIVMFILIIGIAVIPSQIERFVRLLRENMSTEISQENSLTN